MVEVCGEGGLFVFKINKRDFTFIREIRVSFLQHHISGRWFCVCIYILTSILTHCTDLLWNRPNNCTKLTASPVEIFKEFHNLLLLSNRNFNILSSDQYNFLLSIKADDWVNFQDFSKNSDWKSRWLQCVS